MKKEKENKEVNIEREMLKEEVQEQYRKLYELLKNKKNVNFSDEEGDNAYFSMGGLFANNIFGEASINSSRDYIYKNTIDYYLRAITQLEQYRNNPIVVSSIEILKDLIIEHIIDNNDKPVLIEDNPEYSNYVNEVFRKIKVKDFIKNNIDDYIYFGNISLGIEYYPDNDKFIGYEIIKSYKNIAIYSRRELLGYLMCNNNDYTDIYYSNSEKRCNLIFIKKGKIVRIGSNNMILDISKVEGLPTVEKISENENVFVGEVGTPLFYYLKDKLKEVIIKELISSIMTIKDLLMPIILTVSVEPTTGMNTAVKLSKDIADLLTSTTSIAQIISSTMPVEIILESLQDNIRVIPDFKGSTNSLQPLDTSKIFEIIDKVKGDIDDIKNRLYEAIGIPEELIKGTGNKWEILKTNERLSRKINNYIKNINHSLRQLTAIIIRNKYGKDIPIEKIKISLFRRTNYEYNEILSVMQNVNEYYQGLSEFLNGSVEFAQNIKLLKKEKYIEDIKQVMKELGYKEDMFKWEDFEENKEKEKTTGEEQKEINKKEEGGNFFSVDSDT